MVGSCSCHTNFLVRSIEEHKKMIKTLEHTLQSQLKKLEEMTDGGDDVDVSSERGGGGCLGLRVAAILQNYTQQSIVSRRR